MKTKLVTTLIILMSLNIFSQETLKIDTLKSEIQWVGEYAFYFGGHEGTIDFKEGYFIKKNGSIIGGEFVIDMTTISSTDIESEEGRESLDKHLKSNDFFEVDTYPNATLVITNVYYETPTRLKVSANLTIKGITKAINFRGEANYDKKEMSIRFKIDRTLWGITYNSKEVEGKLKDGLISDAIEFEVLLSL